jgi:5S rRNA maturation endonuclease (ribonuclease M5)
MTVVETGTTNIVDVLTSIGVEITRVGEREINGRCPVHVSRTGKADKSPSWSMNATTGAWLCFSCGARGSLMGLVHDLTGSDQLAYDFYATIATVGLERLTNPVVAPKISVDWVAYGKFAEVPDEELEKRSITRHAATIHGIKWDTKNDCWVIPVVDKDRNLIGWQSKKKDWVRNYPVGIKKSVTLFGLERFKGGTAILLESPLDVVRLTSAQEPIQGLASFGSAISTTQISLLEEHVDRLIVAMDNDEAGLASAKKLFESLPRFRGGTLWLNYRETNAKDIGDMTNDEIHTAIETSTALPGWLM